MLARRIWTGLDWPFDRECFKPCNSSGHTTSREHCLCLQLKAVQLIKRAEVIVYDDLGTQVASKQVKPLTLAKLLAWQLHTFVQAALDEFASPTAVRKYVGKRGQKQSIKQPDIDNLLVDLCQQVVCLLWRHGTCG